jgi:hypothetical protein
MPTPEAARTSARESGRYAIHVMGQPCGEERWMLERTAHGAVATGEQVLGPPCPVPGTTRWSATLDGEGRVTGVEIEWRVGERALRATHAAKGERWAVRIETDGHVREQEGDYPPRVHVVLGSHLFHAFVFAKLALAPGAEHVVAALSIGPPWMAVEPTHLHVRCTDAGTLETPFGPVAARRIEVADHARGPADAFTAWIGDDDFVLASREGPDDRDPWMTLVDRSGG